MKEKAFLQENYGDFIFEKCKHNVDTIWSLPEIMFIKNNYPELIEKFNIPLDEYPRRCINQIESWKKQKEENNKGQTEIRKMKNRKPTEKNKRNLR